MFIQETLANHQKHKLGNPKINQWDTQIKIAKVVQDVVVCRARKIKKNTGDEKHYFKCI